MPKELETESVFPRAMVIITTNRHQPVEEWDELAEWIALCLRAYGAGAKPWYKANVVSGYKVVPDEGVDAQVAALRIVETLR